MVLSVFRSYILFALRVALPFAVLPVLAHQLGTEGFGVVLICQSLGLLGSIIVQYGFHVSASRDMGRASSEDEIRLLIGDVLSAQIVTSIAACMIVFLAAIVTPHIASDFVLITSTIFIALGVGLAPAWYFRGTQRSATSIALELFGQIISLVGVLVFVRTEGDVGLSLVITAVGPVVSTAIGYIWMFRERGVPPLSSLTTIWEKLKNGFALFLVRVSSTGFTMGANWLAGLLTTAEQAAYFGVAAKVVGALTSFSQPVLFALLPRVSKEATQSSRNALTSATKWGGALVFLAFGAVIGIYLFSDLFMRLVFPPDMKPANDVMRSLVWLCVLAALRDTVGDLALVPIKKDSSVAVCVLIGGLLGVLLAVILVPQYGAQGMVAVRLISEAVVVFLLGSTLSYVILHSRNKDTL